MNMFILPGKPCCILFVCSLADEIVQTPQGSVTAQVG